jgi:hypothetical protein
MSKNEDVLGLILSGGIGYHLGQKSSDGGKAFDNCYNYSAGVVNGPSLHCEHVITV